MTEVPVQDALSTMWYAFNDAVHSVYYASKYDPAYGVMMRQQDEVDNMTDALETMIYILLYPLNPALKMSRRGGAMAENILGQYDDYGIVIEYPDGTVLDLMF